VGLGAVGGACLESLVRSGVGHVRLVDFDTVGITNLNRQILATHRTLGMQKTTAAYERMHDINPDCKIELLPLFVDEQTIGEVLGPHTDLLVDAIDSLSSKCLLLESAYRKGIPSVSSMGAALRRDPSLVRTADLTETYGCPLARQVRTNLRKRGIGEGIQVVFSPEKVRFEYKDPTQEYNPDANAGNATGGNPRRILGSLPTVTSIFGQNLAHLALANLVGGDMLRGEASS
jgi:tRNA A37 threonylcarbamoyladenosine dehydratase